MLQKREEEEEEEKFVGTITLILLLLEFSKKKKKKLPASTTFPGLENKINKIARSNETNKHNRTRRSVYYTLVSICILLTFFLFFVCVCGLFSFLKKSNCERTLFKIYVAKTFSSVLLLLLSALPGSVNLFYLRAPLERSTKLCCQLLILSFAFVYKRPAKPSKMGGSCRTKTGKDGPQQYKDKPS